MSAVTDPTRGTAAELADALADGETSSVELTRAHLDRIAVIADKQGQGLGAAQLAYVLRLMAGMGAAHVALSTQLSNAQSHKLYERFGFTRTGDKMDFFGLKL